MVRRFRLVPATLFGQTVLILLAGLAISAALGYSILTYNQVAVVRAMGAFDAIQRIVSVTRLLDDAPAAWRGRLIKAASGETLRITASPYRPVWAALQAKGADARTIRAYLATQLPPNIEESLSVSVETTPSLMNRRQQSMPDAELGKVFEPFYRLETSRSRETGGSGLGLAIALAIIEAHGGKLELSNRSGGGLSANVTLTW